MCKIKLELACQFSSENHLSHYIIHPPQLITAQELQVWKMSDVDDQKLESMNINQDQGISFKQHHYIT